MKKLKYIFIALAVIILAIGGYVLYQFKFKTYDVADEQVDEILEETLEIPMPDGTVMVLDKEGNVMNQHSSEEAKQNVNVANAANTDEEVDNESTVKNDAVNQTIKDDKENESANNDSTNIENTNNNSTNAQQTTPTTAPSVEEIKAKYAGAFASLEGQANSRLNALIGRAKSEYVAKTANGESIEYGYFYNKYMGAATAIEASIDSAVNSVVGVVKSDLQANGYDASHADSFISSYEETKSNLRSQLMGSVMGK